MISPEPVFHLGIEPPVIRPLRWPFLWAMPISRQRMVSTCGAVGAVVTANAEPGGCVSSHQDTMRDALNDLPVSWADRTATRRFRTTALAISTCFDHMNSP